jgi:hypothetical protein
MVVVLVGVFCVCGGEGEGGRRGVLCAQLRDANTRSAVQRGRW